MRRLAPPPVTDLSDVEVRAAYRVASVGTWVRVSLVSTLDGATRGPDGTSMSISPPADRRIFPVLRASSDVILVGAGSVRAGYYRPSRLPIAVVTRSLDLSPDLPLFAEATQATPRSIVYTLDAVAESAPGWLTEQAHIIGCGRESVSMTFIIEDLVRRGLPHVHCEGGPTLASALAEADLVDEFLVSVAPALLGAGADDHLIHVSGGLPSARGWRYAEVLEDEGTVFVRLVRR